MTILIDVHEPQHFYTRLMLRDLPVERTKLEIGDYHLPYDYVIERKTIDDLLNSLYGNDQQKRARIWMQLRNLSQYEHPILAIVAGNKWKSYYFSNSRSVHSSILSFLISTLFSWNIPVVMLDDDDEFILFIEQLYKYATKDKPSVRPAPKASLKRTDNEILEDILCMIPNVGVSKARLILEHFGTIAEVAKANVNDLIQVKGIGKKIASSIVKYLREVKYGRD